MLNNNSVKLGPIGKEVLVMAIWGIVMLAGGLIQQYGSLDLDSILIMWGILTLVGVAGQALAYVKGLGPNNIAWAVAIVLAWGFTFLALKANIQNADLYEDMPAVWFILLGIAFAFTGLQVDKRFYILAGIYAVLGIIMEISLRFVSDASRSGSVFEFFAANAPLLMGVVGGGSLLVGAVVAYLTKTRQTTNQEVSSTNAAMMP